MRLVVIAIASTLGSCTWMGSSLTALNPTQDSCASRGLTLDPAVKQCVVPPPAQSASPTAAVTQAAMPPAATAQSATKPSAVPPAHTQETTGSLPSPSKSAVQTSPLQPPPQTLGQQPYQVQTITEAQSPSPEHRVGVSIEPQAVIKNDPKVHEAAIDYAHFVRASGYRCDSVSALTARPAGVALACNNSNFRYAIDKDAEGHWVVSVQ